VVLSKIDPDFALSLNNSLIERMKSKEKDTRYINIFLLYTLVIPKDYFLISLHPSLRKVIYLLTKHLLKVLKSWVCFSEREFFWQTFDDLQ
jgi:hypothetical protein